MSSWDIDPPGVSGVVTRVAGHVTAGEGGGGGDGKTLQQKVTDFGNHIEDAGTGAASAPIGTALMEFVEHYSPTIKGMGTKTGSCIRGAVAATRAYIDGDLEMAAEAQRNATQR
jgi:hypothetical protein